MPVKTKAKDHSQYMRTTTHHNLTHLHERHLPMSDGMKVLIFCGIGLAIAIIVIGLYLSK